VATTLKVKTLLGVEVYARLFPQARKIGSTPTISDRPFYRVIGNQVMGRELTAGTGKKDQARTSMDPTMCQHPTADLMPRGSKTNKWWTCKLCQRRWEREFLSQYQPKGSDGLNELDLVTFGKYAGETYNQVYETDRSYVDWVLMTAEQSNESSPGLQRLAKYFVEKESRERLEKPPCLLVPVSKALDMGLDDLL